MTVRPGILVSFIMTMGLPTGCLNFSNSMAVDDDGDGYAEFDGDCDDGDGGVYPGASEVCNEVDDDCDGHTDEDLTTPYYADEDADGYGDISHVAEACEQPAGHVADSSDCDDGDEAVNPDAVEVCNAKDDDCDDAIDEGVTTTYYADEDGDGAGDPDRPWEACSQPDNYAPEGNDCDDGEPELNQQDLDLDGYGTCDGDCDDQDASRHPDAPEVCNEVDDDCDGNIDEDASDAGVWYLDTDRDGYGDPDSYQSACACPAGHVEESGDCDDNDSRVYPGADELCNGEDDDCSGVEDDNPVNGDTYYLDVDGDGFGDDGSAMEVCEQPSGYVSVGSDCDDGDAAVNPRAREVCNDGIDNDCDGTPNTCGAWGTQDIGLADAMFIGEDASDHAGKAVSFAGDVDADGYDDLLVGADGNGIAYLVRGPVSGTLDLSRADAELGDEGTSHYGIGVAGVGDTNSDGFDDLLVGVGGTGAYLFLGPVRRSMGFSLADAQMLQESSLTYTGFSVAGAGDVDGDGNDDILVGAPAYTYYGDEGAAYLVLGPVTGNFELSLADAKLVGETSNPHAGGCVAGPGDVNGDGLDDLLVGAAYHYAGPSTLVGAAYLVMGPVSGEVSLSSADATFSGEAAGDFAGISVSGAGDLDGDGLDDLLVGAPGPHSGTGSAYLILGPTSGSMSLAYADGELVAESGGDYAGWSVSGAGDVDGDGVLEWMVGAQQENSGGTSSGAAYVVSGPVSGTVSLSAADGKLIGEASGDLVGYCVSGGGDFDGNGMSDLLIGAPYEDSGGSSAGAAYLFYGGGL